MSSAWPKTAAGATISRYRPQQRFFWRPIHVVGADGAEGHREFLPPGSISKELWGQPIYVAYVNFKHFEATGPLDAEPPPKRERSGKVKMEPH